MDGGHWGVLLNKYWVLELPPSSALCAVLRLYRAWMPLYNNGLVVHAAGGDADVEEGDEHVERRTEQTFEMGARIRDFLS